MFFSQIQGGHCYSVRDRFVKDSDHEENESNDEDIEDDFEDSELARGRVSKFYWWVAIKSQAWGLVSLIV